MSPRSRLLLLAYSFPPVNKVGAVRAFNIAKHLTPIGWQVTVVTPAVTVWRRVESAEDAEQGLLRQGVRCIRTDHRWRLLSPVDLVSWDHGIGWAVGGLFRRAARFLDVEREAGWISEAEAACAGLNPEDVDLILATGPPFGSFRLAGRLSQRLGVPFVMDYRDLWTGNPHVMRRARPTTVSEERRLLNRCAAATAISPSLRESLVSNFAAHSKVSVVSNGYDPEDLRDIRPFDFGHFAVVYTGTFYPPKRVISPVMAAIQRLKRRSGLPEWNFHYYGVHDRHVHHEARRFGVQDKVILHGGVSRREALSALRGAAVSVVITSIAEEASLEDRGIVTGKIFEAVGLGTPILAVAPRGSDIEEILERTKLGQRFAGSEIDQMEEFLVRAIDVPRPQSSERHLYSWANIARRLDAVLRGASTVEAHGEQAGQPRQHEGLDPPGDANRISLSATDESVRIEE